MPDSFAKKAGLIRDLLVKEGLEFKPGISKSERERLDALRIKLATERGWGKLSVPELMLELKRKIDAS